MFVLHIFGNKQRESLFLNKKSYVRDYSSTKIAYFTTSGKNVTFPGASRRRLLSRERLPENNISWTIFFTILYKKLKLLKIN